MAIVNTLFQEKKGASQPKGWIQGNTKIWPVVEVATSYLHGKYGVEVRIIGSNKFVLNLDNDEQEIPEVQLEDYALKMDAKDFACRSKAETKPQRREPASSSSRTVPIEKRIWTDVEPGKYSCSNNEVSKNVTYPLRHSQHVNREEDEAVQFWRIKDNLQKYFLHCPHWSDEKWKKMHGQRSRKQEKIPVLSDTSGAILYLRALQGHSGPSLIDPTLQDHVTIPDGFLQVHLSCRMCNQFTFHHQFGIDTGR